MSRTLSFFNWEVHGLGHACRCDDVLSELLSARPSFVTLQETKLPSLNNMKKNTFLPSCLSNCVTRDSMGASGGMLTAWDASLCSLDAVSAVPFTLSASISLLADTVPFKLTNVYAPTLHDDKPAFFSELASVADSTTGAWMILGDFNLKRCPEDKNTATFNTAEANCFNDLINTLGLIEIPLVDRAYTWSSRRDDPTLVRLDRCFVNIAWDDVFPNTTLSSLTRFASDHVPLLVTACTRIPRSVCFRFENSWMHNRQFPPLIHSAWGLPAAGHVAKSFIQRLKNCRRACCSWSRRQSTIDVRENDTEILINALDLLEEQRPLQANEASLRCRAIQGL